MTFDLIYTSDFSNLGYAVTHSKFCSCSYQLPWLKIARTKTCAISRISNDIGYLRRRDPTDSTWIIEVSHGLGPSLNHLVNQLAQRTQHRGLACDAHERLILLLLVGELNVSLYDPIDHWFFWHWSTLVSWHNRGFFNSGLRNQWMIHHSDMCYLCLPICWNDEL